MAFMMHRMWGKRRWIPATVLAAALVAVALVATGAGARVRAAHVQNALRVTLPLPAPGQASVELLTVTATGKPGKSAGPILLASIDPAGLPAGIRSVADVIAPKRPGHRATFQVFFLINNLALATGADARPEETLGEAYVTVEQAAAMHFTHSVESHNCPELNKIGAMADAKGPQREALVHEIVPLRGHREQESARESVLDHVIYRLCEDEGAEMPEPGEG